MNKYKIINVVLNIISFCSFLIPCLIVFFVGEANIFDSPGMGRYSWVFLLFIPIPITITIFTSKKKHLDDNVKVAYVFAIICGVLLTAFGALGIKDNISDDYSREPISSVEKRLGIELPNELKCVTSKRDGYTVSYIKIENEDERSKFENELKTNNKWTDRPNSKFRESLPDHRTDEIFASEYIVLFNEDTGEYNKYPEKAGEYKFTVVAYDIDQNKTIILSNFIIFVDD